MLLESFVPEATAKRKDEDDRHRGNLEILGEIGMIIVNAKREQTREKGRTGCERLLASFIPRALLASSLNSINRMRSCRCMQLVDLISVFRELVAKDDTWIRVRSN